MTELEKVISCFKKSKAHEIMPACYNPSALLRVYDTENDYKHGTIIDIFKDPEAHDWIGIKIKYDDDTTQCYKFWISFDIDLPINTNPEYTFNNACVFDYTLMTENKFSKYRDKIWPNMFEAADEIYLEYVETIDSSHANYKLSWVDQSNCLLEYFVTLSRDDINKLLENAADFIYDLQDAIHIMKIDKSIDDEE